jgi:hypothetical protein
MAYGLMVMVMAMVMVMHLLIRQMEYGLATFLLSTSLLRCAAYAGSSATAGPMSLLSIV